MARGTEWMLRLAGPADVSNVRAGAFYEREGFTVERVEPSVAGDPALDVVWRTRPLTGSERT